MGINIDASGAFRCYNLTNIKSKDILSAKDDVILSFGKVFLFCLKKYLIHEIPIELPYRSVDHQNENFRYYKCVNLCYYYFDEKSKY